MTYRLQFKKSAQKEWNKLGATLKDQLKKKLIERLIGPRVESDKVMGGVDLYKIKLRQSGYRLVYQVKDDLVVVEVIAIGKRERNQAYKNALKRIEKD
jgi:mRNA interferase RelE/StbE